MSVSAKNPMYADEDPVVDQEELELRGNADEGDDFLFELQREDEQDVQDELDKLDAEKLEKVRVALKDKYNAAMEMIDILEFPETIPAIKTGSYKTKKEKHCREEGPEFWDNLPKKKQKKVIKCARNEFIVIMNSMSLPVPGFILKPKIAKLAKSFRESLTLDYAKRYCRLMKKAGLNKEEALAALERDGLPAKGAKKAYRSLLLKTVIGVGVTAVFAVKTVKFTVDTAMAIESDIEKMGRMAAGEVSVAASINPLDQIKENIPLESVGKVVFVTAIVGKSVMYAASSLESKYCKPYEKMYKKLLKAQDEVATKAFRDGGCCCCCCC